MKTAYRLIATLLTLVLLCAALPLSVIADDVEYYNLWLGDMRVTSDNCNDIPGVVGDSAKASYDHASKTLTLENVDNISISKTNSMIYCDGDLTIELVGNSALSCSVVGSAAIYASGSLTVKGEGSLEIRATDFKNAIRANDCFTMEGGELYITGMPIHISLNGVVSASQCLFKGGTFVIDTMIPDGMAPPSSCRMINAGTVSVFEGANVYVSVVGRYYHLSPSEVIGYTVNCEFFNVSGGSFVISHSLLPNTAVTTPQPLALHVTDTVDISGGIVYVDAPGYVYGIYGKEVNISGGRVVAYGFISALLAGNINICGGDILAEINPDNKGFQSAICASEGLTVTGGSVKATAKKNSINGHSFGIFCGESATFKGGRVEASGDAAIVVREAAPIIIDNAFLVCEERYARGIMLFGPEMAYYTFFDASGIAAMHEVNISPRIACYVSRDGGEEEEFWWQYGPLNSDVINHFDVPVGESISIRFKALAPGETLDYATQNGDIPKASEFLDITFSSDRTEYYAIFKPTYLPQGYINTQFGSPTPNWDILIKIFSCVFGSSHQVGTIRFSVVPGEVTINAQDIIAVKGRKAVTEVTLISKGGVVEDANSFIFGIDSNLVHLMTFDLSIEDNRKAVLSVTAFDQAPTGDYDVHLTAVSVDRSYRTVTDVIKIAVRDCYCDEGLYLSFKNEKGATCTEAGNKAYYECEVCGRLFVDANGIYEMQPGEIVILPSGHVLAHHEAKAAGCTEHGWEEYDTCSWCDYSTYAEAPALGHDLTHHEAKAAGCTEHGWEEYDTCS
ncbi:MAG: carbohydrate-binding domain-containing protein, partial [Clostridia bacterium]|nr:carbohydrate-binding domain-containing protein [Clostridia bacterium]